MYPHSLPSWTPLGPDMAGGRAVARFQAMYLMALGTSMAVGGAGHRADPVALDSSCLFRRYRDTEWTASQGSCGQSPLRPSEETKWMARMARAVGSVG